MIQWHCLVHWIRLCSKWHSTERYALILYSTQLFSSSPKCPAKGCHAVIRPTSRLALLDWTSNFNTSSAVYNVVAHIRELSTFPYATWINQILLSHEIGLCLTKKRVFRITVVASSLVWYGSQIPLSTLWPAVSISNSIFVFFRFYLDDLVSLDISTGFRRPFKFQLISALLKFALDTCLTYVLPCQNSHISFLSMDLTHSMGRWRLAHRQDACPGLFSF